jgi:hypothetical protein
MKRWTAFQTVETKWKLTYLCMLLRKLHVIKYPEQYLKEILPPMRLECIAISFDDFKQHSETSCTYIQLATTYYT